MKLVKRIVKAIQHKSKTRHTSAGRTTRVVRFDLGSPRPGFRRAPGSIPLEVKVIEVLVRETGETIPIIEYLSRISDLVFVIHESDVLFGGTYYWLGKGASVMATVVPAQRLHKLPRDLRQHGWMYVSITCDPKDDRFDRFLGYEVIPASYNESS